MHEYSDTFFMNIPLGSKNEEFFRRRLADKGILEINSTFFRHHDALYLRCFDESKGPKMRRVIPTSANTAFIKNILSAFCRVRFAIKWELADLNIIGS